MKKIALYPFNKITHAVVRFRDLIDYEIKSVIDFSLHTGKDAGEILDGTKSGITIHDEIEKALEGVDTLIINENGSAPFEKNGYESYIKNNVRDKWKQLLLEAGHKNINIIATHDIVDDWALEWIKDNDIKVIRYKKSREDYLDFIKNEEIKLFSKENLISIFATSPNMGKFTTQMTLFRELKNAGKNVQAIITEPTNFIFNQHDMEDSLMYDIPLEISEYMNAVLNKAQRNSPEFLIMASQGGVGNDSFGIESVIWQVSTLKTFNTDKILLIVGYDDDERIKDSIDVMRIFGQQKPLALLLPDRVMVEYGKYEKKSFEEIEERRNNLKKIFNIEHVELIQNMSKIKDILI